MDPSPTPSEFDPIPRSTAGMTTKVIKGGAWNIVGQLLPVAVSFLTAPIVIRLLGSERYGVWVLVGLIPAYLAFADFGMTFASTRFAANAFAAGDDRSEAAIVRTAAVIAFLSSLPFAIAIIVFAAYIPPLFNIPPELSSDAVLAFRLGAGAFVVTVLSNVVNTPQLTRMRMDLNTMIGTGSRILGQAAAPIVIYFGYGVAGAAGVLLCSALIGFVLHVSVSTRLLGELKEFHLDRTHFAPLLRYGGLLAFGGLTGPILGHGEKVIVTNFESLRSLSHYSIAFTVAMLATFFSTAMVQSLIPAFAQLLAPDKHEQRDAIFKRSMRLNLFLIPPLLVTMAIIAKPAFTLWAGEEFGLESPMPFYILLVGVLFNALAYPSIALLIAAGRTGLLANLAWIEVVPHLVLTTILTARFGIVGAAAAWTVRVVLDSIAMLTLARRRTGVSLEIFDKDLSGVPTALGILVLMLATWLLSDWMGRVFLPIGLIAYAAVAWFQLFRTSERDWLMSYLASRRDRKSIG